MVTLTIDGIQVTVPRGTMILEAATRAGIRIPTLCNNKRLQPFGACRLCVVQQKGRSGLIPSCFNPVRDGMEILTNTPEILSARRIQLQLILISHPLDCPVCDAGGACALQDLVYEYGIVENPYQGSKNNEPIDHVSPFIERNTNRCILCGMCVRIDDEVVGANELSFMNRGDKVKIGTDFDRPMDCEFCGQCISVCPVGALNDRLFLHKARPWDLKETQTVCGYCSIGCSIVIGTRDNRIVRVRADEDLGSNEGNLCVKGRFGWEYIQSPERLTTPLIRKDGVLVPSSWEDALKLTARRFNDIRNSGGQLAGLASSRLTNEEAYLFQKLLRGVLQTNNVDHAGGYTYAGHLALRESLGYAAATNSFREIRDAEVIVTLGPDVSESHPVVKYEIVQAVKRHKAKLIMVDGCASRLKKFASLHLRVKPGSELALVNGMIRTILDEGLSNEAFIRSSVEGFEALKESLSGYSPESIEAISGVDADSIRSAARLFAGANKAVILIPSGSASNSRIAVLTKAAANLALITGQIGKPGAGIMLLPEKNNAQGSVDMGLSPSLLPGCAEVRDRAARNRLAGLWGMPVPAEPGMGAATMLLAAEVGNLQGLYLVGENPLASFPDPEGTRRALSSVDFLVVQDCFLSETVAMAHVVLPAAVFAEKEGTFTSAERRVQRVHPIVLPPGAAKTDLWIFQALATAMGHSLVPSGWLPAGGLSGGADGFGDSPCAVPSDVMEEIRAAVPFYAGIDYRRLDTMPKSAGLQWPCMDAAHPGTPRLYETDFPEGKARLLAAEWKTEPVSEIYPWVLVAGPVVFHSGTMSLRSPGLKQLHGDSWVEIHADDAARLGCREGQQLVLESPFGKVISRAVISDRVSPGLVFMPHHFGLSNKLRGWDLEPTRVKITACQE